MFDGSTQNHSTTVTIPFGKLDLTTTYKGCFLLGVFCRWAPSTFKFTNACTALDPTTIEFSANTTAALTTGCLAWYSQFLVFIVYSDNDNTLTITYGTLTSSSALLFDPA